MSDTYQDRWPTCGTDGCGNRIYLTHNPVTGKPREHCAECELNGVAPVTELPPLPVPYSTRTETP